MAGKTSDRTVPWTIEDLTEAASWLDAADPQAALIAWAQNARPDVRRGILTRGISSRARSVAEHRDAIRALARTDWQSRLIAGFERARELLEGDLPPFTAVVLVGSGHSNASAEFIGGRPYVFIWLENWLGPGATDLLQDHTIEDLPIWASHELAHALRYAGGSPWTARVVADPVLAATTKFSFRQLIYEEGLATRFSHEAFPDSSLPRVLGMTPAAVDWLARNSDALQQHRSVELDAPDYTQVDGRAVKTGPPREEQSWSLEEPPFRWAYFVGYTWMSSVRARHSWRELLRPPGVDLPPLSP